MLLRQIYDPYLAQYAYLIGCQKSGEALIIDPERDIEKYHSLAKENGLKITAVAETHIHADFVSGIQEFAQDPSIKIYLSDEGGSDWTYQWSKGKSNIHLLKDHSIFTLGGIKIEALHTPGHTPEHLCYLITDTGGGADKPVAIATGDFLFVSDVGRPDLLESAAGLKDIMLPSAKQLQKSLSSKLSSLEDFLQILPGHGAGSACGKSLGAIPSSTLGYERLFNSPFKLADADGEAFIKEILTGQPNPPIYFARMKKVNRDGIQVGDNVIEKISTSKELTSTELSKFLNDNTVKILDTRMDKVEFDNGHLPRSINAPLHSPFFSNSAGSFLDEEDRIILVVNDPEEVRLAATQLFRIGFDNFAGWITVSQCQASQLFSVSIKRTTFAKLKSETPRGIVIDVRTTAEYENSHLVNAVSYPYTRIKKHLNELPKETTLYVHCASGRRASLAASFLASEGFKVVHVDDSFIKE